MRSRLLIFVLLILIVIAIAAVILLQGQGTPTPADPNANGQEQPRADVTLPPTATPIPMVNVVIALQNLPRGYRFPDKLEDLVNVVTYTPWPESAVPFNALREDQGGLEQVLGKVARTDIFREQPLLTTLLVEDLFSIADVGSDAAAILPSDRVAITLPMDRFTGLGYGLREGDHVDLIVSFLFVDVDEIFQTISPNKLTLFSIDETTGDITLTEGIEGRPDVASFGPVIIGPSEKQRPRMVTQMTVQDAIVVHVGEFPLTGNYIGEVATPTPVPATEEASDSGSSNGSQPTAVPPTPVPPPDMITLAVSPQNAVFIAWYIEAKLPVTLALRSVNDVQPHGTQPVTLDYIMNNFNITVPGRRDFSIEPAIRSIRQMIATNEISLSDQPAAATGN